ncbi:MAG: hypothetical protein J6J60_03085 [Clostridia bacterium]|nr:hypothetical protein [Clostridia bacterium]
MVLNLKQTKIAGLYMKLDLKAREYNMLCGKLEEYKKENIKEDDVRYFDLLQLFQKNNDEIIEIKQQLIDVQKNEEKIIVNSDYTKIFEKKEKENIEQVALVEVKESIFKNILNKIKKFFESKFRSSK